MSNYSFGGPGGGPGMPPPPPPGTPNQMPGPGGQSMRPMPPSQPVPQQQPTGEPAAAKESSVGVVGVISLLVMALAMIALAVPGNRVWPFRADIDSAWRNLDGKAGELTGELRGMGYTCSDTGIHAAGAGLVAYHRICAKYTKDGSSSIDFSGTNDGEIMRVFADPGGNLPAAREAINKAIELGLPDGPPRSAAKNALTGTPTEGPWGKVGMTEGGALYILKRWDVRPVVGALLPGSPDDVMRQAAAAGYGCNPVGDRLVNCQRTGDGANWSLAILAALEPGKIGTITLTGNVIDEKKFEPGKELERIIPKSSERDQVMRFMDTADDGTGAAGYRNGLLIDYRVRLAGDKKKPAAVHIVTGSPCRNVGADVAC